MKTLTLVFLAAFGLNGQTEPQAALWSGILGEYVSAASRVDYARLKQSEDVRLKNFIVQTGQKWPDTMSAGARKAAYINAYNALTIDWILKNYPVASIWRTKHPFSEARHLVDGKKLSLDQIEKWLRDLGDPRIHAVLVCAARGCPPLRQEAYVEAKLDEQLDANTRAWLANNSLNRFLPEANTAEVSKIFDWYRRDFPGGVPAFLVKYAPQEHTFLQKKVNIRHKAYHWGLNDSSQLGEKYSQTSFLWDVVRNK